MELLNKKIILLAIYKHKALQVDQLQALLGVKSRATIATLITRYRRDNYLSQLKTPVGVFYFLTTKGAKLIGYDRVNRVTGIEKAHTDVEIMVIRHLVKSKVIKPKTYEELLNSYKTDREIKREKFAELGGEAHKFRWVDILVTTTEGKIAYEVEITKKNKERYPAIVTKLDSQSKAEKWLEIVWVIHSKDKKWFAEVLTKARPTRTHSVQPLEEWKPKESNKELKENDLKLKKTEGKLKKNEAK